MKTRKTTLAAAVIGLAALAGLAAAQPTLDAVLEQHPGVQDRRAEMARGRTLFYTPPPPPAGQPGYLGLCYKILLLDLGGRTRDIVFAPDQPFLREVSERYPFHSGDCIRMKFQTNADGYLYIFHRGSNSQGMRLFPDPRINGGQNFVYRFEEIVIPSSGWFQFDERPGVEDLYLFFSPQPIGQFNNLMSAQTQDLPEGAWTQVTAATTSLLPPRPDAVRSQKPGRSLEYKGDEKGVGDRAKQPAPPAPGAEKPVEAKDKPASRIEGQAAEQPVAQAPPPRPTGDAPKPAVVQAAPTGDKNIIVVGEDVPTPVAPVTCFVTEQTPILIHHIRLQHRPR